MSAAVLRRATVDDLAAIMALEVATFPSDAWSEPMMRAELEGPHGHYLVATSADDPADAILGYAGLLAPIGTGQADIQTVAVDPGARRRGIGRALVEALLGEAARRGAEEVFLEVRADNPGAEALYAQLGFARIAVREHYYQPDDVAAIVMQRTARASTPRVGPIGATP